VIENIVVLPFPGASFSADNDTACISTPMWITYNGTVVPNAVYNWDFDGATVITASSNSGGPYKVRFNDSGAHIISLKSYTTEGCESKTTYDTVKVHALPSAKISNIASGDVVCFEDSVLLRAAIELAAVRYEWNPVHYFDMPSGSRTWARIENRGFVRLRATDAFGCTAIDSVYITPESCCELEFPTAFTPNGDGKNDQFRPVFKNGGYHRFSVFRVTNRWGQTVFETTNNRNGWDGTFKGQNLSPDVYGYYLRYKCIGQLANDKQQFKKGNITLIR
jgi:gliding motility-associated-like protein